MQPTDSPKLVTLQRTDGTLVRVPWNENKYAAGAQGLGFGIGCAVAVGKMVTYDIAKWAGEKLAETNVGLGAKHGYQATYLQRDTILEARKIKASVEPTKIHQFAKTVTGIDTTGMQVNEVVTLVARAKVIAEDRTKGINRLTSYHQPVATVRVQKVNVVRGPVSVVPDNAAYANV